jgi:23S rRNA pseudouridine1911/1915/1917 synthase
MNALLYYSPSLKQLPRAGLVHRLDKGTSGLLLVAKTTAAYQTLIQSLKSRHVHREYRAVVKGVMITGGQVSAPIGRNARVRTQMAVRISGKTAITNYRIIDRFQAHTYLSITLQTGRTHQIRVHMAHIHYPLLGDATYGKHINPKGDLPKTVLNAIQSFKRQALHAYRLKFIHPMTLKKVTYVAPIPNDLQQLLHVLKHNKDN